MPHLEIVAGVDYLRSLTSNKMIKWLGTGIL